MIGVIADDLSGAAEIGAIGLRHGLRAEIALAPLAAGKSHLLASGSAIVCVDTDSRTAAPEEAARRAAAAARMLRRAGAKWIYKKVDSVLRGNVLAETEAVARQMGAGSVLLHPANPSLGRIIRDGRYFVRGKPIHKTEFARDPAHPRRTDDVCALLNGNGTHAVCVGRFKGELPQNGIVICESTSPQDVRHWAERAESTMLLAGGAEFFAALLDDYLGPPSSRRRVAPSLNLKLAGETPAVLGRELFVCGSTSQSSKEFISTARKGGTPIFSLPREVAWGADFTRAAAKSVSAQVAAAFETESRVILRIGLQTVRNAAIARRLSSYLTQLAEAVLQRVHVSRIYAEGGATAVDLARRMGWTRLEVIREVAPGVATLAVNGDHALEVTIKPGTYVWPEEIQTIFAVRK